MKTKKEFPATHSMSTEWFVADQDGNIALFDFNEEGPVPEQIMGGEGGWLEDISAPDEDGINSLELTDEQAADMLKRFKPISSLSKDNEYDCIVQLKDDERVRKSFIAVFKKEIACCLSRKERIYLLNWFWDYEASEEETNKIIDFLKATCIGFYQEYFDSEQLSDDSIYPLYCYIQPYASNSEIPKKTAVPKHPLNVSQIPEEKRKELIHVPVKFSECPGLQIAQYVVCKSYYNCSSDDIKKGGRIYSRFPKTGGGFCYILQDQDIEKDGEAPIILDAEE